MSQGGILSDNSSPGADVETLTGNSGGAVGADAAFNINTLGTGSITIVGVAGTNTLTTQLTGLTANNVLLGAGTATITKLPPSATVGVPLVSAGAAVDPIFGTAVVAGGGTGVTSFSINGVVISNTTTTGALAALTLTNGQIVIGATGLPPVAATLTAGTGISITNAANSITISTSSSTSGTATTVGAVTADVITLDLGATPATYALEGRVAAFESATPSGFTSQIDGAFRTTGVVATEIDDQDPVNNREAALAAAVIDFVASGNNMILRVTGVAGLTINWVADLQYTKAT